MKTLLFLLGIVSLSLLACSENTSSAENAPAEATQQKTTAEFPLQQAVSELDSTALKSMVGDEARAVVEAIANKNMDKLAEYVHPDFGVRISPYAFIDTIYHVRFSPAEVKELGKNEKEYNWGTQDGSGFPLNMTFDDYYKIFIYNKPYVKAERIGYGKPIGSGNMVYNYREVYPEGALVEYYLPGSEQFGGMDWGSLILVFVPYQNEWKLVQLAHGQWTT